MKKVEEAISASVISSALPIGTLVYFFRISAIISVPPEDAPQLKIIALPAPVINIARINSRNLSPSGEVAVTVIGKLLVGTISSIINISRLYTRLQ